MLALIVFDPRLSQDKDWLWNLYLLLLHKEEFANNQENMSKWSSMSICGLLFQWAITIKIQPSVLVLYMFIKK
jgi:hypothetical protein